MAPAQHALRNFLVAHAVISAIFIGSAYYFGSMRHMQSIAIGCALVAVNVALVIWTWQRIFLKKSIALAALIIVFKYAILGLIIYFVLNHEKVDTLSFTLGLLTIMPSMVVFALQKHDAKATSSKAIG